VAENIITIKNHKVKNGDLMQGIGDLMQEEKADFIYSDPPWGVGNLRYWQTMNLKMNDVERVDQDYDTFIDKFFSIIKYYATDRVVIEYGKRWRDDIIFKSNQYGFIYNGNTESFYKSGSKLLPLDIHFLSKKEKYNLTSQDKQECRDYNGLKLVEKIFDFYCPKDAKIILDPMCGMGYTAQATINRNLSFRGNELNKTRLGKTIQRLSK
tara:strand:+ start:317 stop:946 length:630 start_codon:yes stop_codon:yes gene_type:complete